MLSWAVWFKFLLNKVIANTYLFILTSFGKQSASWKVLEICELCALSTDSRKTYSLNKYIYTDSSSYSFDWGGGGIIRWGGRNGKDTNWKIIPQNGCTFLTLIDMCKIFFEYPCVLSCTTQLLNRWIGKASYPNVGVFKNICSKVVFISSNGILADNGSKGGGVEINRFGEGTLEYNFYLNLR